MKLLKRINIAGIAAIAILSMLILSSCNKEEAEKVPAVTQIVLTKNDASTIEMNRYVTITGTRFDDVQEVLFNELSTYLNPNYVTSSKIVVQIPNEFPDEITNKVSLITKSKIRYDFDFTIDIPAPEIAVNGVGYTLSKNLITITGVNLAKVQSVSIGGINVTDFTTSSSFQQITFTPPANVPAGVIKVTVVCPAGSASQDFDLDEAANPAITEIPCEWVDEGKLMQINGRNLALITAVIVNGTRIESGFVYNDDNSVLKFPMPSGIASGSISVSVENEIGRTSNTFSSKYKTSEFLFWNFDDKKMCWGAPESHLADADAISGKFALIEGDIAPSWWDQNNMFCGCGDATPGATIINNPGNYVIKFEVNVANPWSVGVIRFSFNDDDISYDWVPYTTDSPYQTDGWKTISIPLSNWSVSGATLNGNYRLKFFTGPETSDAENTFIAIDNFRIDAK